MRPKRLLWRLFPTYLAITLGVLAAVSRFSTRALEEWQLTSIRQHLEAVARLYAYEVGEELGPQDAQRLQAVSERIGQITNTRITLILPDGVVLCDNREQPARMENHADRPEVKLALKGEVGEQTRYSNTVNQRMQYVALPLQRQGKVIGVARASQPVTLVEAALHDLQWRLAGAGVIIAGCAAVASWFLARRISRPLEELRQGAQRFAGGQLEYRLHVPETDEMAALADSMNTMAVQLQQRIRTISHQRNEQEAILSSMVEGVVAVDTRERIISLNHAAAALIGSQEVDLAGRTLQEAIRNPDLRRFVVKALARRAPIEDEIILRGETSDRIVHIRGAALADAAGTLMGAVVVLNDMTQFRRLENIRRDFVANVSHELRTPVASIKGFVETLLDGALEERADAERFLKIVAKQADRLNAIIEDLLSLSKIEQSEKAGDLPLAVGDVLDVLEDALHDCQPRAAERDIPIRIVCPEDLQTKMNAPLLEQAVANLLDNAIKYSEPGQAVVVEASADTHDVTISVRDHGCGIAHEHLARIFERFYRVDKARSRKLGGTGLGLAIVKHIISAHGGRITVESTPGEGSNFVIRLPRA